MNQILQRTAFSDLHKAANAKCVPFANHELPIWFTNMKEEHLAVRQHAGMFDISHMGLYRISGLQSDSLLRSLSCNDIAGAESEKMIYSMFLNEAGMILDDVMLGQLNQKWHLVVNGANRCKITAWLNQHALPEATITPLNATHAFLAVQGPKALSIIDSSFQTNLSTLPRFGMQEVTIADHTLLATRTGYTGEDGVELMIPNDVAPSIWQALKKNGVQPCGLAARDSLRIEYGLPLYGQELSDAIHPLMTRYPWVVKSKSDFIGKHALETLRQNMPLKAVGLTLESSLIARPNYPIQEGGHITSGTLSPITGKSIALAFVPVEFAHKGKKVSVQIRKHSVQATVCSVPFI